MASFWGPTHKLLGPHPQVAKAPRATATQMSAMTSDLSGDFGLRRDGFGAAVEDAGDAEEAEEVQSDAAGLLAL